MALERSRDNEALDADAERSRDARWCLVLWLVFTLVATGLYGSALTAPFVSDDIGYLVSHPYTESVDGETIREMFDPWGPAKLYTANYAPVHLLLTAIEREMFAEDLLGYHLVNVVLHALAGALLVVWLWQAGIGRLAAIGAGVVFLVHPANVEAVAWCSQLKTVAALVFSLGALVTLRRLPAVATLLFMLGLLTKASAMLTLPVAAVWAFTSGGAQARRTGFWLVGWLVLTGLYAVPQYTSFAHLGAVDVPAFDEPWVQARTIAAIGARYLVMALTSYGVSAWHEPLPVTSWGDPWLIGGLLAALLMGGRFVWTLFARSPEAMFWVAVAAAFAPVSQLFPFATPMADRYLYFMLPGLLGGILLAARALAARLEIDPPRMAPVMAACAFSLAFVFGCHSANRMPMWQHETRLLLDAAIHYPEGATASFMRARRAAQDGDLERALEELRVAADRGIDRFMALPQDPGLAPLRDEPAFRELVKELAGRWIARARSRGYSTQPELRVLGIAHLQREEYVEAVAAFERSLHAGGPLDATVRVELEEARVRLALNQGRATEHGTR